MVLYGHMYIKAMLSELSQLYLHSCMYIHARVCTSAYACMYIQYITIVTEENEAMGEQQVMGGKEQGGRCRNGVHLGVIYKVFKKSLTK